MPRPYRQKVTCPHPERKHHSKGRCSECSNRARGHPPRQPPRKNTCGHPERRHAAKGKCGRCYRYSLEMRTYGITWDDYWAMRAQQFGRCAICRQALSDRASQVHIDHDHRTGRVRGVLCRDCNVGLGCFKDSAIRLRSASNYLIACLGGRRHDGSHLAR